LTLLKTKRVVKVNCRQLCQFSQGNVWIRLCRGGVHGMSLPCPAQCTLVGFIGSLISLVFSIYDSCPMAERTGDP
jgi:hypothetical protein